MYSGGKPLLPCWTNKRKLFKNKGCVYIPQSAFHCGKRCLGGLGGSEPQWSHVCCHTAPQVSPQALLSTPSAAGGALHFCIENAASQCPAAPGSCRHTVPAGAFLSSETPGSQRRGCTQLVQPPNGHQHRGIAGGLWPSHAPSGCEVTPRCTVPIRGGGPGSLHGKGSEGRISKSSPRLRPPDFPPKKILAEKPGIIYK